MLRQKLVCTLVVLGTALAAAPAQATTYPVLNSNDQGADSLRDAILDANGNPGLDQIEFNIPGGNLHVIHLATDLPAIEEEVIIRGYSQPGAAQAAAGTPAVMKIALDAAQVSNGLVVQTDDSVIRGLVVHTAGRLAGGDGVGVRIEGDGNRLVGSYIGLDGTHNDTFTHGNAGDGVQVVGNGNFIGGDDPEDRNVISGNGELTFTDADGVSIVGDDNRVRGNAIGTDPAMVDDQIGNSEAGVRIEGDRNIVGGALSADNVIAGNQTAVLIASGTDNEVVGNLIGTDAAGETGLGNSHGVIVESSGNVVGGPGLLDGNVIAGTTTSAGLELLGDNNTAQRNLIGTDKWGEDPLPNFTGIRAEGDRNLIGEANVVSGNLFDGVTIIEGALGTIVEASMIGTAVDGVDPVPNGHDGITIVSGSDSTIEGNVIAHNGQDGVDVLSGVRNSIVGNSIFANGDLGIDLLDDGVTANDANDIDRGPNDLLNFPMILAASKKGVDWALDGRPSTTYRLEFYACDGPGRGEGATLVGSASVTTDGAGDAIGSTVLATESAGPIAATATVDAMTVKPSGLASTSEFSLCVPVS